MTEILQAGGALLLMLMAAGVGWLAQRILPDHHRSRDSVESVRLVITMLVTFSALVLGLLTSSAKSRFDGEADALSAYGVGLIRLDQRLREFGPAAAPIRPQLRAYIAGAIADTWPDEPPPAGEFPRFTNKDPGAIENRTLGAMLTAIEARIDALPAGTERERGVGPLLRTQMEHVLDQRWRVVASFGSTMSWPFLSVLLLWLVIIFATFGLSSPRNQTLYATIMLCALLIASSLYLIFDYETPTSGLLRLSSAPMRQALAHMEMPD